MNNHPLHVLVTGATSGIGLHLAQQFAAGGHAVTLLAPVQHELAELAEQIRRDHGVPVHLIVCDLEQPDAAAAVLQNLAGRPVDVLVNNAGQGYRGKFWQVPLDQHLSVLRLNVEAVLRLTALLLPSIIERGRGGVLNIASVAAFEPGPTMAVYHASKAFLLSWSEALASELDGTGVSVTALCPGPTDTDFFEKADLENSRAFQQSNLMAPQDVAKIGYEAFMNKERVIVAGVVNKAMVAMRHVLPESVQASKNAKQYEDVAPGERDRQRGDKEMQA